MLRSGQYPDASTETKRGFVTDARVGIFFKIGDDWLVDSTQVASGEAYGDAVQHGGHYEYWESATPGSGTLRRFTTHDYDYFPRGRVVFFPRGGVFRVYVDNCLTQSDRDHVLALFGLENRPIEFENNTDGIHYVCSRCSSGYLE